VRIGRAQEEAEALAGQHHVVGVLAGAGEEAGVLAAAQRLADRVVRGLGHVGHGCLLGDSGRRGLLARLAELDALTMLW
jgi:hypothetical protein